LTISTHGLQPSFAAAVRIHEQGERRIRPELLGARREEAPVRHRRQVAVLLVGVADPQRCLAGSPHPHVRLEPLHVVVVDPVVLQEHRRQGVLAEADLGRILVRGAVGEMDAEERLPARCDRLRQIGLDVDALALPSVAELRVELRHVVLFRRVGGLAQNVVPSTRVKPIAAPIENRPGRGRKAMPD
jgi:hypothetical protein